MEFRTGCCWRVYKYYMQKCEIHVQQEALHAILDGNELTGVWSLMVAMVDQKAKSSLPSGGQASGVGFLLRCWPGYVRRSCMIRLTSESQWSLWSATVWPVGSEHKQRMNTIIFLQPQQILGGILECWIICGDQGTPPETRVTIWFPLRLWWCVEGSGEARHIVRAVPALGTLRVLRFSLASLQWEQGGWGLGECCSGLAFVPSRLAYWVF